MARSASQVTSTLLESIQEYRQKYYQNQLLKGALITLTLLIVLFLVVNTIEYFGQFNSLVRGLLLASYIGTFLFTSFKWVVNPLIHLLGFKHSLTNEEAAIQIGKLFPEVGDKLLNTLQLTQQEHASSDLIQASIKQKSEQLLIVRFSDAIRLKDNKKYVKYLIYPIAAAGIIYLFNPHFFTTTTERIIHFNTHYNHAPFEFVLQNESLKAYRNDDVTLQLQLKGNAIPSDAYIISNGTRHKLTRNAEGNYSYTLKNVQRNVDFQFAAAGYESAFYQIQVFDKPSLLSYNVKLTYPVYLGKRPELLENVGNFTVPEGTEIEWHLKTNATENVKITFDSDSIGLSSQKTAKNEFKTTKKIKHSEGYQIHLLNTDNQDIKANYFINSIADQQPEISIENYQDSTLFKYLIVGGSISDDYGFSRLGLTYSLNRRGDSKEKIAFRTIPIAFNKNVPQQSFYFQWNVDSLGLQPGDKLDYYVEVWDNDGVNGPKNTRTHSLQMSVPERTMLEEQLNKEAEQTQKQIQKTIEKSKSLEKDLKQLENKLKLDNQIDFQERKQLEDILQQRNELLNEIKRLQEQNSLSNEKSKQFSDQSEALEKKLEELQKIMDKLLNEDTNKLYKELEKLKDQKQSERLSNLLERIRQKEQGTEKELERTLNLFKKLQMEQQLERAINQLNDLAEQQEKLSEQTEFPKKPSENFKKDDNKTEESKDNTPHNSDELLEKQQQIEDSFEKVKEELKQAEKLGDEINQKPDTQNQEQHNASEEIKNSKKQLSQKNTSKAADAQKKAAKSMRNIAGSMESDMESGNTKELQENMDALRDILENTLTLSFNQEKVMKEFREVSLSDPRFVTLSQQQLKLKDDAKIVTDSLYALANRVEEIQTFVTREVEEMNYQMNESLKFIKERRLPQISPRQQFAMTSMNNLALMLSDVFKQMQQAMAMAMNMPGTPSNKKNKQGQPSSSPGGLQEQLNQQMREMGQTPGQTPGKNRSEQLARMAAQQAQIREMLQKMLDDAKGTPYGEQHGKNMSELLQQMEKSETEIVNKKVTPELIRRNEQMTIRLLEHEKGLKEQGEDNQRKGEIAKQLNRKPPAALEQYLQKKHEQTELIRTVPLHFSPFYKKETDAYFQRKFSTK